MTIAWMVYALVIGGIISIAAVSAEWALKSAQRPVRFVWVGAIILTAIFSVVAPLRVEQHTPVATPGALALPAGVAVTESAPTTFEVVLASGQAVLQALGKPVEQAMTLVGAVPQIVNQSAAAAWFIASAMALSLLLLVYVRSRRESARWPRMHILGNTVRVAPDVGPAVIGIAPAEIVIPQWVLKRHEDEQRLVLQHEAEHLRAHDPLLLVFACTAVALMPWHAGLWFMWSRLRLAVELDCDRRVLNRGVRKPAYGELLVELSSQRPWNSLVMPAFSWGTSHLEKRLLAMTAHPARFPLARAAFSAGVVALSLVAACRSELPTATDIAAMDASSAVTRVGKLADSVVMFVDGKPVSEAVAHAIPAADIAKIEVVKRNEQRAIAEVRITMITDSARVGGEQEVATFSTAGDSSRTLNRASAFAGDTVLVFRGTPDQPLRISTTDVAATNHAAQSGVAVRTSALPQSCTGSSSAITGSSSSSDGGSGARVRIRGQSSVSSDCQPIVFVDGVRVDRPQFDNMNPDRIESIEVIKGAAASALYGAQGVNGVIVINLKKE